MRIKHGNLEVSSNLLTLCFTLSKDVELSAIIREGAGREMAGLLWRLEDARADRYGPRLSWEFAFMEDLPKSLLLECFEDRGNLDPLSAEVLYAESIPALLAVSATAELFMRARDTSADAEAREALRKELVALPFPVRSLEALDRVGLDL